MKKEIQNILSELYTYNERELQLLNDLTHDRLLEIKENQKDREIFNSQTENNPEFNLISTWFKFISIFAFTVLVIKIIWILI